METLSPPSTSTEIIAILGKLCDLHKRWKRTQTQRMDKIEEDNFGQATKLLGQEKRIFVRIVKLRIKYHTLAFKANVKDPLAV